MPVPDLVSGRLDFGAVELAWRVAPAAPMSHHIDPRGGAFVLGDAIPRNANRRVTAAEWWQQWTTDGSSLPTFDGFHAGLTVRDGVVRIAADILGLFPIYWATAGDVFVASSSIAPFAMHPALDQRVDIGAVFGHLLTSGPFDGRTVHRGVTRLAAGAVLTWNAQGQAHTTRQYAIPPVAIDPTYSAADHLDRYATALEQAVVRHTADHAQCSLLLSGGRDSRLLAGYLTRHRQASHAFTLGHRTDHDARFARHVGKILGIPHQVHDAPFAQFPDFADRTLSLEYVSSGMSSLDTWAATDRLRGATGGVLSGYVFEARQIAPLPSTRDGMLAWTYAHAMHPDALRRLVRAPYLEYVDDTVERIHAEYARVGAEIEEESEQSWRWLMAGYARFHAGAIPWRLAFSAWPILPILDQALLEVMLSMPRALLENRAMQDAVIRQRLPALARVPLDRNAANVLPLTETLGTRLAARLQRTRERLTGTTDLERRYYYRIYNFDSEGWRGIRRAAEPMRAVAETWCHPEELMRLVPPPEVAVAHRDPIGEGFAPKMLTGMMRLRGLLGPLGA